MCLRSSSVPKSSTLISTNWPQLRSTASRHIFSSWGSFQRWPGLRMSMASHGEHTHCELVRISMAPSLSRVDAVKSLGSSRQLRKSSAGSGGGPISRFSRKGWDFPGKIKSWGFRGLFGCVWQYTGLEKVD